MRAGELPAGDAVLAQAGDENFPVAGLVLGARDRRHLLAIYGFARLVDDVGDEVQGDRLAMLDRVERELACIYDGTEPTHPLLRNLRTTVKECALPRGPFERLLEANRRDQVKMRYQTFAELLSYCQLSAAPVGELVLHVFGAATPQRTEQSDAVCAGLQVIEHLQDVAEDCARGRIYLPQEDLARAGCTEQDLLAASARPALRGVVAVLADRSKGLIDAGAPLVRGLPPRQRLIVAGFLAGGRSTLAAIEGAGYDVLGHRPRRTRAGFAAALWGSFLGR